MSENSTKLSKSTRISKEIERLNGIYKDVDKNKRNNAQGLIQRAAYMKATLEDYEQDLDNGGYVEMFSQSPTQAPYERERPVARLYNSMNKNYQTITKLLTELLPKQDYTKVEDDGFDGFLNGREEI